MYHYEIYYNNGQMTSAGGTYFRISDVDVKPAFSVMKAKEIYARYLNTSPFLILYFYYTIASPPCKALFWRICQKTDIFL